MKIGDNSPHQLHYNDQQIENVDTFKYLGHILTNKRNIHTKMSEYLTTQAQKALFALQGDTKQSVGYITPTLAIKMFDTYILPILEYNCELWTNLKPIHDIEKIQLGYLKNILGIRRQTPSLAVYGETGRFPLHVRQQIRMVNYWLKLKQLPVSSILGKCLEIHENILTQGQNTWLGKVKHMISEHVQAGQNENLNVITKSFSVNIYMKAQQNILAEINDSAQQPKLRTYKLIKTDYRIEPYLLLNLSRKTCSKIARFRTSSHNLRIETGRHERPIIPADERLCVKCNLNEVEDEVHALIDCPNNESMRQSLFELAAHHVDNFQMLDNRNKFKFVMCSKEPEVLKCLGKFLVDVDV